MIDEKNYKYLSPRHGSAYKQFFVTGTRIRAGVLNDLVGTEDYPTAEEVAKDYDLPVEAVLEAVHYCEHHPDVLEEDWQEEEAVFQRIKTLKPSMTPADKNPD